MRRYLFGVGFRGHGGVCCVFGFGWVGVLVGVLGLLVRCVCGLAGLRVLGGFGWIWVLGGL